MNDRLLILTDHLINLLPLHLNLRMVLVSQVLRRTLPSCNTVLLSHRLPPLTKLNREIHLHPRTIVNLWCLLVMLKKIHIVRSPQPFILFHQLSGTFHPYRNGLHHSLHRYERLFRQDLDLSPPDYHSSVNR